MTYVGIIITFVFINNFIFTQLLGLCPFISVSKNMNSAIGVGIAVMFVMISASFGTSLVYSAILVPLQMTYLHIIAFMVIIVVLVHVLEIVIRKTSPVLYRFIGIHLPLIATNCAVLGIAFLCMKNDYNILESVIAGFAAGLGFTLSLVLMSSLREKMAREKVPQALRGTPIAFISAGLMSMAFMAFDMTILKNIIG
jgi:electron transport complex protein RnfA